MTERETLLMDYAINREAAVRHRSHAQQIAKVGCDASLNITFARAYAATCRGIWQKLQILS